MSAIELVEKSQLAERPAMKSGDTVRVHVKVREGDKERIQVFEGVVIGLHRGGTRASFTVRKVSFGQGVERIFPLHSPTIQKVEVMRSAKVRRAKLYYLRDLKGKAARMKDTLESLGSEDRGLRACTDSELPMCPAFPRRARSRTRCAAPGSCTSPACDEVGRGCLAGPVVAAAVVLHPDRHIPGVCDSKTVPAAERERLYDQHRAPSAVAWAVGAADPAEIDRINIHQASLRAMQRAVLRARAAARHRAGRRVPRAGPADGAARRAARRPPLLGDRRRVDRRQGDARSPDARAARPRSALRLRSPQGLRDRRSPRRRRALRLLGRAPPLVPRRPTLFDTID